ncbi:caspase family protein [Neolewinella litorea]|uniref:Peptidase C14 caspase catalytic subunit p20 n=1 Tax=Neolewinella litorea TaxID=2562452 RepID=A0A4S4NQE7_9BACT|nr:caspase family protein [Neolewinella litorea]THH41365.1 peptidase C14 caspase catalytic subunit p20 [Neolewinella litorea]
MLKSFILPLLLFCTAVLSAQGRCQRGNCYEGEGILRFADGALYTGNFKKGKFEGQGTLTYPDGSVFSGNFRNQLQSGYGTLQDANGNLYDGMWRDGRRHGRGKVVYAAGGEIIGTWVDDRLQGEAAFAFANRDYYVGNMVNNVMEGYGTMEFANGDVYRGEWKQNQRNGNGRMIYADGTEYNGEWENGVPKVDWATLGFIGNTAQLVNCNEGCPDGDSRYTYADGTTFFGETRNGTPNGKGTVIFPNGNSYHGQFHNHRPNGLGVMQYAGGEIEGGIWRDGQLYRRMYSATGQPAAAVASSEFDPEVKVWAVVVGCAYYQHMKTLRYTDDDAYQFYAFLKSIEGGALSDDQVKVLIDEDATHDNILAAMRDTYRQADENDVILFYFSGHGLPGSFLPVDYDGQAQALAHEDVHEILQNSRSRHKLVIADACHSGSLVARGVGSNQAALTGYYSALTNAKASTALMMSSRGEEISLEDGGLRSGVFSHYLIRGMKGEADVNQDGMVSIQELFNYVHREVRGYTGNVQTPTLTGNYDEQMPISVMRAR